MAKGQFFNPFRFMSKELLAEKHVKCITVYSEKPDDRVRTQELRVDQNGRLLLSLTFWGKPLHADSEVFVYDGHGNETQCVRNWTINEVDSTGADMLRKMRAVYASEYENDRLVRSTGNAAAYELSGSHYSEMRYDTLGNLVECIAHDTIARNTKRTCFVYDKERREILRLSYDEQGEISAFEVTTYDENGRRSGTELRNSSKYIDYRTTTHYFYDPAGRLIGEERLDDGKPDAIVYEYRYDSSGLLTQIVSNIMNDTFGYTYY